ncbi:MAG TPA: NAD-dependent epimerase/dehydratase family protein [Candidatus Limnocylindrales bacterium]|nr:NAD-dependent epimerase/dehydratase family protein [Candidatus Limnocylindrales bacterium]
MARTRRSTEPATTARKRVVVTGGAGLVGRAVIRTLRERGDEVVALVRDPARAPFLAELGAELVESDLSDVAELTEQLRGADALIHAAGSYRIGISRAERGAMWDANVGTTTRALDAAEAAGTKRIVYVSTINAFGNTHGRAVDESYRRDLADGFLSWYDETKYGAHEVAEQRIAGGAPIVIVMPSQVYGPGDRSAVGEQLRLAHAGKLRYRAVDAVRIGLVHADDLASGIVAALDRGRIGEAYILSGPHTTLREAIEIVARLGGHRAPALHLPDGFIRAMAPFGALIGQPNLREVVDASAGVSYLASPAKAQAELGFAARPLEEGLRDVYGPASSGERH